MIKRIALVIFGVVSIATLSGCSALVGGESEYGCKGMPDAVTCKSVEEVYQLTDGDDYKQRVSAESKRQLAGKDGNVKGEAADSDQGSPSVSAGAPYVPVPQPTANPQPIRTPSQVMRVLVDPYESEDGDLNVPGYVYTEIEPRRWEVGATRSAGYQSVIRPVQVSSDPITAPGNQSSSKQEATARNQAQKSRTMIPNR